MILALLAAALLLSAIDAFAHLTWLGRRTVPEPVRHLTDVTDDYSLSSWVGFACLFVAGFVWLTRGCRQRCAGLAFAALFFVALGCDDAFRLHERAGELGYARVGGHGVYPWVVVLGPVFAIAALWVCRRMTRSLEDTRARRWLWTGFGCLALAFALEVAEERVGASGMLLRGLPLVRYSQALEELLELLGPLAIAWSGARRQ